MYTLERVDCTFNLYACSSQRWEEANKTLILKPPGTPPTRGTPPWYLQNYVGYGRLTDMRPFVRWWDSFQWLSFSFSSSFHLFYLQWTAFWFVCGVVCLLLLCKRCIWPHEEKTMSLTARTVLRRLAHRNIDWYVLQLHHWFNKRTRFGAAAAVDWWSKESIDFIA